MRSTPRTTGHPAAHRASVAILMVWTLSAGIASAQTPLAPPPVYTPTSLEAEPGLPRTADGRPDFQGVVWTTNFFPVWTAPPMPVPLELPEDAAKQMFDMMAKGLLGSDDLNVKLDPEVEGLMLDTDGLPIVRGKRRTRLVVLPANGKLPLTPEARAEINAYDWLKLPSDNPEERPTGERCLYSSPPIAFTISLNPRQFIQTRDHVVLHLEQGDEARIIPYADALPETALQSRLGTSIARWEGDTLVIETRGLPAEDRLRNFPAIIINPDAKLIERFTRLSMNELLYQFTIEDPTVFTAPWLAEYSLFRTDKRLYSWSCHEANYSLPNVLKAGRVADQRAAADRR